MDVFENFENQLKANPKTIVFTEGTDARILSAASKLLAGKILNVLLLGNPEAVKKAAAEGGFDSAALHCPSPTTSAPCWSRWVRLTACWAALPILPLIPFARLCS